MLYKYTVYIQNTDKTSIMKNINVLLRKIITKDEEDP